MTDPLFDETPIQAQKAVAHCVCSACRAHVLAGETIVRIAHPVGASLCWLCASCAREVGKAAG